MFELLENGSLRKLEADRAALLYEAWKQSGGHLRYDDFGALLDGWHVLVPGASAQPVRCAVGRCLFWVRGTEHLLAELDFELRSDDALPMMNEIERALLEELRQGLAVSLEHGFAFTFNA